MTDTIDEDIEPEQEVDDSRRNLIFAAPADDPRARRPADAMTLVFSLLVVFLLAWTHRSPSDFDQRVGGSFGGDLPGWLSGTATIVFLFGGVYTLGLIVGIGLFGHGRGAVARDMLIAAGLAMVAVLGFAALAGPEWPDALPEFRDEGVPSYPVIRLTMAVAALKVASPYLSVPMRTVGRRLLIGMTVAALIMSYGTLSGVIGGLVLGVAAAAAVHLIFGSGLGIPSKARIMSALRQADLEPVDLQYLDRQSAGATLVRAQIRNRDDVQAKIYGRDASDSAFASRLWRHIWYRDAHRSLMATSQQLIEHESLMLLKLEREHVAGPRLVAWTRTATDDGIIVTGWLDGKRGTELQPDDTTDARLDQAWEALGSLHQAGIANRELQADRVLVMDDGVVFDDFSTAVIVPDAGTVAADRAQLLVGTATLVGNDRAIAAAHRNLGDDGLRAVLPLLQTAALPSPLQKQAKHTGVKVKELREEAAEAVETEQPELVQLERVSWKNLVMAGLALLAVYSLWSALADIGFDTIVDEMSNAIWGWVAVAFVLAQLTNVGEYLSLEGVIGKRIPFGPTIMFRYALSFVSLAVPSEAGAIAMNIRYQEKLGVPAAAAIAQGPLLTLFSKGFDVILLIISARFIGQAIDLDEIDAGPIVQMLVIVIIVAVIAVIVVLAVPKLRHRMLPHVKDGFSAVKGAVTDPARLTKTAGGTLLQKILFALTLSASVAAYGSSLGFGEAIFVNTAVSLFISLVPVPGGIGVAEAGLTAALTAVGVPEEAAVAAAITHRMVTAYIPPVLGWWASKWLTERDYL